jgi:hypothetical protein
MQFGFIDLATGWKSMRITRFQRIDIAVHMRLVFPIQNIWKPVNPLSIFLEPLYKVCYTVFDKFSQYFLFLMVNGACVEVFNINYPPEQSAGQLPTPRIFDVDMNQDVYN